MAKSMKLIRDGDELVLPLPDELIQRLSIEFDDEIIIDIAENGQLILRKKMSWPRPSMLRSSHLN